MWNPTTQADDITKNKEDIEDCACSSSSSVGKTGQKSTTLGQLSSPSSSANSKKEKSSNIEAPPSDKKQARITETSDSGFLSGPQSEQIDYEDEEEAKDTDKDKVVLGAPTSSSTSDKKATTETSEKGDGSTVVIDGGARGGKNNDYSSTSVLDSGCITGELCEEEDDESVDEVVAEKEEPSATMEKATEAATTKVNQSESTATSDTKPSNTTAAKLDEDNNTEQMTFKHSVETESNNLNAADDSRRLSSSNIQAGNNQSAPAGANAPSTMSNRTPNTYPWEQFYKQNDDGDTALHLACIAGCLDVITALIRMAPHPCLFNIQNDEAQTPLHLAALTAQPNILRILLLAGAEPTIRDRHGNTALHLACIAGEIQCVRALTTSFAASEIHEAHRQYGHRSNDKALSSLSYARLPSDLEIRNYDGERCVHLVAQGGHIDILRILVSHGADINAREGKSGRSPLHIAIECRNEDLANFLLDECEKLNLETATYAGLTAYQVAQILNNAQMQNILEKRGAEPLTPPDSDYDNSDSEDLDDTKFIDRFGDPSYFANYNGGNPMTVA